jgi:hypothetical protein
VMHQNRQIRIHSRCLIVTECKTNYHYPQTPDGTVREGVELPAHDWASHMMDGERYLAMGVFNKGQIDPEDFVSGSGDDWLSADIDVDQYV